MLTLLLLRHAKSDWGSPDLSDRERPLNKRGTKAASQMGQHIAKHRLKPDHILCSDAVRARATLALVLPELGMPSPHVTIDEDLYLASAETILAHIRKSAREGDKRIMVIGHNPGMHGLALTLIGDGNASGIKHLAMKYPTAGLAVLKFDTKTWDEIKPAKGHLEAFVTPKELH